MRGEETAQSKSAHNLRRRLPPEYREMLGFCEKFFAGVKLADNSLDFHSSLHDGSW